MSENTSSSDTPPAPKRTPDPGLKPSRAQLRQQEREAWMREHMRHRREKERLLRSSHVRALQEEGLLVPDLSETDGTNANSDSITTNWLALLQLQNREALIRKAIAESLVSRGRNMKNLGTHNERHYSIQEIGALWGVSAKTIKRIFQNEPGVLVLPSRGEGERPRLRIPESIVERVHRQLQQ